MCVSLAKECYDVHLICFGNEESLVKNNVNIHYVHQKYKNKFLRILFNNRILIKNALNLNAEIYHIHDPELLLHATKLKLSNKVVIYDSHEDVPSDILDKNWIGPRPFRIIVSLIFNVFEKAVSKKLDGVISVSDPITSKFFNSNKVTIHNYPLINQFIQPRSSKKKSRIRIIYSGGLSSVRGIKEIIDSLHYQKNEIVLYLAGSWESYEYETFCKSSNGWKNVFYLGLLSPEKNIKVMSKCDIGIINYHPIANHIHCLPNKIYEYFAAGLVVQMSNIDYWKKEFTDLGFFHESDNPKTIAHTTNEICNNLLQCEGVQKRALEYVKVKSWENEFNKLNNFYNSFFS